MKVLVTGANGFIGVQVCRDLLERDHEVVALCHRHRDRLDALPDTARLHLETGDILDGTRLQRLCAARGVDGVCHLAVQPPDADDPHATRQVNVQGTRTLLEVCHQTGIRHLVYASSMSVYNFLSPAFLPVDEGHHKAIFLSWQKETGS